MVKDLLVFDMDGVLVDVSESYRAAIQATVLHFTGHEPTNDEVEAWKKQGRLQRRLEALLPHDSGAEAKQSHLMT